MLLMNKGADAFVKNDNKPGTFHANAFYRHARAIFDGIRFTHFEQDEETFPTFPKVFIRPFIKLKQPPIQSFPYSLASCVL